MTSTLKRIPKLKDLEKMKLEEYRDLTSHVDFELDNALDAASRGKPIQRLRLEGGSVGGTNVSEAIAISNSEENIAVRKTLSNNHETISRSQYEILGFIEDEQLGDLRAEFYNGQMKKVDLAMPDADFHIYSIEGGTQEIDEYIGQTDVIHDIAEFYDQEIGF